MKTKGTTKVSITHRFSASAERVFDAWLDPEKAGKFLFATATGQMVRVEIDARVGGTFTIVDRRNGEDVTHVGTYLELDRPRRIVFMLSVPKYSQDMEKVTIEIKALGDGCELTLTHEMRPESAELERRAIAGWTGILEVLSELLPSSTPSCGMGLAQHSTVPAKVAALFAALAETLDTHRTMLELEDVNARNEDVAYRQLASSYRDISRQVQTVAAQMAGYRDLPMGAHDENGFTERHRHAFESFVQAQHELLAILKPAVERDDRMFSEMSKSAPVT